MHTIYGTMQGGHDWYKTLSKTYDNLGYITSCADPCVWFKKENGNYMISNTYTDDTFRALNNDDETRRRKEEIRKVWEVKDIGENDYFLGMRVQQDIEQGIIWLTQWPYWEHIIDQFNPDGVTPRNTPLPAGIIPNNNMSPKMDLETKSMNDKPYRPILGSVIWGQLATCPNLSFTISLLGHF